MDGAFLKNNWALIAGVALMILVAVTVLPIYFRRSSYGQLRKVRSDLKIALRQHRKAISRSGKDEKRVQRLDARIASTKPRMLQDAKDSLADSRALEKIARDKVMIAENQVRRVIHEEYPPTKHQRMRARLLPSDQSDEKPFSF